MKIIKAKNGNWQVKEGRLFKIEEFEPNLKRVAKYFTKLDFEEFFRRLKKHYGIKPSEKPKKMIKVKVILSGGCWNIRTLNDKLVMIHDTEYSEKKRQPKFRKPRKRKKKWKT